jgi:hypothetical protein
VRKKSQFLKICLFCSNSRASRACVCSRAAIATILSVLLTSFHPARADGRPVSAPHARAAVAAGLIRPLAEALSDIEAHYSGQVIEAELFQEGRSWSYEFEILPPDGRIFIVYVDAASGQLIRSTGQIQVKP